MKKFSALLLIASMVLLATLWFNEKVVFEMDHFRNLSILQWVNSFLKTIIVLLAYIAGFFAMILITLIDIFSSIIWKIEFPILHLVYDKFFIAFSKGWYWDQFPGVYHFISGIVVTIFAMIVLGFPDIRRNQRIVYDPGRYQSKSI